MTDGTVDLLEEFKKVSPFPVRVYVNDKNHGFADIFLEAASMCNGDWVAFGDQDDVLLSNKLSAAAEAITRNPGAYLILQNSYICSEALQYSGRLFPFSVEPGVYGKLSLPVSWLWQGFLQTVRRDLFTLNPLIQRPPGPFDKKRR